MPRRTAVVAAIAAALSWAAFSAGPADANGGDHDHGGTQVAVPTPTVAGPVSTPLAPNRIQGFPYTASAVNLRSHSYTEKEYFVSGTARAYSPVGTLGTDGRWTVTQASTAPYKTRILVRRPLNMHRFSGNVVVEWMNATTGRDLDVGWTFGYNGMLHNRDIYVGVTTQGLPITSPTGLIAWDPQRYGSLSIPNDAYSYDIFSQVGKALLSPQNSAVLGGARPKNLIGYGDSQSAFRLVTYVDAIQPRDRVYSSFLIHSRFGTPAALNTGVTPPSGTIIRTDTSTAKIITLETESDIARNGGYLSARQPDSASFRLWELTGGSHISADEELLQRIQAFKEWPLNNPPLDFNVCTQKTDDLDEGAVVDTALHDLGVWTSHNGHGAAPPRFPVLGVNGTGSSATYVLDPLGNTIGGLRMPQITVPIETLHGLGNTGSSNCTLEGVSGEFSTAQLQSLYPTHADYVAKFTAAVRRAQRAGILEPYDADDEIDQAEDSAVPATSYVP
jgi:alpha/beta hydrolase family protein